MLLSFFYLLWKATVFMFNIKLIVCSLLWLVEVKNETLTGPWSTKIQIFASEGTLRFCSCFKTCKEIYRERSRDQQLQQGFSYWHVATLRPAFSSTVNWSIIKMKLMFNFCSNAQKEKPASLAASGSCVTTSMVCKAICWNYCRARWGIFIFKS